MTDTIRDLLISLSSHMAYMQGQLEARHELDDPEDFYWYRESVLLRQKVTDALADEPAVSEGREPTRDELWELWLRLSNELPDRPAAVAEFWEHAQIDARARAAELLERLSTTQKELERERLRLAVCGVVAMADTPETAAKARDCLPEYWSASADDIARQIDKLMRLIEEHYADEPAAPAPPADGEVAGLVAKLRRLAPQNPLGTADPTITRAADLLEQQAAAYAICERERLHQSTRAADLEIERHAPVPVSERLPGPSDCAPWPKDSDASAWCWVGTDEDGGWNWEQRSAGCLAMFPDDFTHWLPAHALPIPHQQENAND